MKTVGFPQIKEGIGLTHRGILGTYTTNFGVNNTSSKVEHGCQNERIQFTKGIMYQRKGSQGY